MSRNKILIVCPSFAKGGAERAAAFLAESLLETYDIVTVVYHDPIEFSVPGKLINMHLPPVSSFVGKITTAVRRWYRLVKIVRTERPAAIVSFLGNTIPILTGAPVIAAVQTHYERLPMSQILSLHTVYKLPWVRQTVTPSQGLAESLKKKAGLTKVSAIPNMVEFDMIDRMAQELVPENLGTYFVAVGRVVHVKRFDRLIKLFAKAQIDPATKLVIIGPFVDTAVAESLRQSAIECGVENRVLFLGSRDNPYQYMRNAKAYVLTSDMETFANVLVESLASGTPVLAFDCPFGPREIIRHGENGLLIPMDDDIGMVAAMERIANDAAFYQSLQNNSVESVRKFSLQAVTQQWIKLLQSYGI